MSDSISSKFTANRNYALLMYEILLLIKNAFYAQSKSVYLHKN